MPQPTQPTPAPTIPGLFIHPIQTAANLFTPPQAYSRVTQTPITWGNIDPRYAGQYSPLTGQITVQQSQYPQTNPDLSNLSGVLRHEQIHALLPSSTTDAIHQFFLQHPDYAKTGQANLGQGYGSLQYEAPAHLAQGDWLGLPVSVLHEYLSRMDPATQATFLRLVGPGIPEISQNSRQ